MATQKLFIGKGLIADGDFLLSDLDEDMSDDFFTGIISVTLYSDGTYSTPVNASAGTLTVTGTEDGFNFGSIFNGVIDLTDGAYNRPSFRAHISDLKGVWAGVTGATHFEFRCSRSTD